MDLRISRLVLQKEFAMKLNVDGNELRLLRKESGLTQAQLGARIGLSRETVSHIENNNSRAINALTVSTLTKWRSECHKFASPNYLERFNSHLRKVLNL